MTRWAHVMSSFRGQWLPGDARGFRDHGHRVHSTGDYRSRPPESEHNGLRRFSRSISGGRVVLSADQATCAGRAIIEKLDFMGVDCEALVVAPTHVHALIRVGNADAVRLFGRAKQFASRRLSAEVPGKMWGSSSHVVRVRGRAHFAAIRAYIAGHDGHWKYVCDCDPSLRQASDSASWRAGRVSTSG